MIIYTFGTLDAALKKYDATLTTTASGGAWRADLKLGTSRGTVVVGRGSSVAAAIEDAFAQVEAGAGRPQKSSGKLKGRYEEP